MTLGRVMDLWRETGHMDSGMCSNTEKLAIPYSRPWRMYVSTISNLPHNIQSTVYCGSKVLSSQISPRTVQYGP